MKSFRIQALLCILIAAMAFPTFVQSQGATMTRGAAVYNEYCKTCHQANGQGLGVVFPPLAKSYYLVKTKRAQIIKEVVNGKKGKMKVNGKEYNGVMTPLPAKYTAEDVSCPHVHVQFIRQQGRSCNGSRGAQGRAKM